MGRSAAGAAAGMAEEERASVGDSMAWRCRNWVQPAELSTGREWSA